MTDMLTMLLDRLLWPSCLVKERACRELASLLTREPPAAGFEDALVSWIVRQPLESTCAYGILVFVKARLDGARFDTGRIEKLAKEVSSPSYLSALFFQELGVHVDEGAAQHSAEFPATFSPPEFFMRHVESFLPPAFHDWAQMIEDTERIPFIRQWSFEWENLMSREGLEARTDAAEYWGRPSSDKRFAPADSRISEVYRSAFLRALAWASRFRKVDSRTALFFAAKTCPVDLALWQIPVGQAPTWWPFVQATSGQMDTTPAEVWSRIEQLWQKQTACQQWNGGDVGNQQVLLAAGGLVSPAPHSSELKILGGFQRCLGSRPPELAEVYEAVRKAPHKDALLIRSQWHSLLRCTGKLSSAPNGAFTVRVADWDMLPATVSLRSPTVPRWQAWRMHYALRAPMPFLTDNALAIEANPVAVQFRSKSGGESKWRDWHRGVQEEYARNQPEPAGYYLTAPRAWIESLERQLVAKFVWICELNSFCTKRLSDEAETVSDYRSFGTSLIVLPD